jgi:ATP-dependent Clp protease ATP-binding subunit ClpX
VSILTEPKNALVKQYQRMFEIDGVELEFTSDAWRPSPTRRCCGAPARAGLRAIMEEVLNSCSRAEDHVMFDVPSEDDIARVVVTREVVMRQRPAHDRSSRTPRARPARQPRGGPAARAVTCCLTARDGPRDRS